MPIPFASTHRRLGALAALASCAWFALAASPAQALSGTRFSRLLTVEDSGAASFDWELDPSDSNIQQGDLVVQCGPDGSNGAGPASCVTALTVTVTIGTETYEFLPAAQGGGTPSDPADPTSDLIRSCEVQPHDYSTPELTVACEVKGNVLELAVVKVGTAGSLSSPLAAQVDISGIAGSGDQRLIAQTRKATFTDLDQLGECKTGGTNCNLCTLFRPCIKFPKEVIIVWIDPLCGGRPCPPFPPDPCWECPEPWKEAIPEGFERIAVVFDPMVPRERLEKLTADDLSIEVEGGALVGKAARNQDGSFTQVVQQPEGTRSSLRITAGGLTTDPIEIWAPGAGGSGSWRSPFFVASALLLVSVVINLRRGRA